MSICNIAVLKLKQKKRRGTLKCKKKLCVPAEGLKYDALIRLNI